MTMSEICDDIYIVTKDIYMVTKDINIVNKEPHLKHYANTPMQYTAIFHVCKNVNFQMKNCDLFLFLLPKIDCGYTLEPPQ